MPNLGFTWQSGKCEHESTSEARCPSTGCRDVESAHSPEAQGWGRGVCPPLLRSQFLDEFRHVSVGTCHLENKAPVVKIRQHPSFPNHSPTKSRFFCTGVSPYLPSLGAGAVVTRNCCILATASLGCPTKSRLFRASENSADKRQLNDSDG